MLTRTKNINKLNIKKKLLVYFLIFPLKLQQESPYILLTSSYVKYEIHTKSFGEDVSHLILRRNINSSDVINFQLQFIFILDSNIQLLTKMIKNDSYLLLLFLPNYFILYHLIVR